MNEMLQFGIFINNVTLVENTGCQHASQNVKRNCMEVYIKLYLAVRGVNWIPSFSFEWLANQQKKKIKINYGKEIVLHKLKKAKEKKTGVRVRGNIIYPFLQFSECSVINNKAHEGN